MLPVDEVDLESLILARNDGHQDGDWWFDPRTGASLYYGVDDDTDLPALVDGVHVLVHHAPQPPTDIDDFLDRAAAHGVPDHVVAELWRLRHGKGGVRRFRDRVGRTEAAGAFAGFTLAREGRRALAWLAERGIVDDAEVADWVDAHPD